MSPHHAFQWLRSSALAALILVLVLPTAWSADLRQQVGVVERLQGKADAVFGDEARALDATAPVFLDDKLVTAEGARLLVRLNDDTEITVGQSATLVVDLYVFDPAKAEGSIVVEALKGAFLFKGGRIEQAAKAEARIVTPVATLGIRGTTAWGGEIDGQYGVLVLDGEVEVKTAAGEVTLTSGLGTSIPGPGAAPGPAKRWPSEKIARALETVEFPD